MENKSLAPDIDITTDVIVPAAIIVGLFLINGIILYIIFKKRQRIVYEEYNEAMTREEAATGLPLQSSPSAATVQSGRAKAGRTMSDNEDDIELEKI